MLDFLKKIVGGGGKRVLGIDVGSSSVKVVELEQGSGGARLTNYAVIQSSDARQFEARAAEQVKMALRQSGIATRVAVIALPSASIFSTLLDVPPMPEKELAQALPLKARQYIPLPISSVSLDWVRVAEHKILLLAIPNDLIQKYTALCAAVGIVPLAFEAGGMSLARLFKAPLLVIDIGFRSTGLFAIHEGVLKLFGQSDFSGSALTERVAMGLAIAARSAEEVKRERGLTRGGGNDELSTLLQVPVDGILNEAGRLRERFVSAYGKDVEGVMLVGGGAHMPGLLDYTASRLGLKAVPAAHVFQRIGRAPEMEAALEPLAPDLAIAAGAALRNF